MPLLAFLYIICTQYINTQYIKVYTNNLLVPQEMREILRFLMAELITRLLSTESEISALSQGPFAASPLPNSSADFNSAFTRGCSALRGAAAGRDGRAGFAPRPSATACGGEQPRMGTAWYWMAVTQGCPPRGLRNHATEIHPRGGDTPPSLPAAGLRDPRRQRESAATRLFLFVLPASSIQKREHLTVTILHFNGAN